MDEVTQESNSILEEVKEKLGDGYYYTERSDGGVIVTDKNQIFSIGLGPNYKTDTTQITYYSGYDGESGDSLWKGSQINVINGIMDKNDGATTIAVRNCYDSSNVYKYVSDVREKLDLNITEFVNIGFSDGGGGTTKNYIQEVKNNGTNDGVILLYDSHNVDANTSDEDAKLLAEHNTKIVLCNTGGSDTVTNDQNVFLGYSNHGLKNMMDAGVDIYCISVKDAGHGQVNEYCLRDNIEGYLLGNIDAPDNLELYSFQRYNAETGELEDITFEELQADVGIGLTPEELRAKYPDNLDAFASRYRGEGETLAANIINVHNECENILDGVNNSIIETTTYQRNDKEANLFGNVHDTTNYFINVSNGVLTNLGSEAKAIDTIVNGIYSLDVFASNLANITLDENVRNDLYSGFESNISNFNSDLSKSINSLINANNEISLGYDDILVGKVGSVSVSSLNNLIYDFVPCYDNEVANASYVKGMLSEFDSVLSGSMYESTLWNNVRSNLDTYSNLMSLRGDAATFLSDTMKAAVMYILDYMAPDTELDDSKLPELELNLQTIKDNLDGAKRSYNIAKSDPIVSHKGVNEQGKVYWYTTGTYSEDDIASYKAAIDFYQDQYDELYEQITKLKGLTEVMNTAQNMIDEAVSQVHASYSNAAKQINSNQSFSYEFKLDLSAYNISSEQYNSYLTRFTSYYENITSPDYVLPEGTTSYVEPTTYVPETQTSGKKDANEVPEEEMLSTDGEQEIKEEVTTSEDDGTSLVTSSGTNTSTNTGSNNNYSGNTNSNTETNTGNNTGGSESNTQTNTESENVSSEESVNESNTTSEETNTTSETNVEENKETTEEENITDEVVEAKEEVKTETKVKTNSETTKKVNTNKNASTKNNTSPKKPNVENNNTNETVIPQKEIDVEEVVTPSESVEEIVVTPSEEINTISDPVYTEPVINTQTNDSSSAGKTIGIAAGIGAAVGAAALGTHTITRAKQEKEVDSDYGYE